MHSPPSPNFALSFSARPIAAHPPPLIPPSLVPSLLVGILVLGILVGLFVVGLIMRNNERRRQKDIERHEYFYNLSCLFSMMIFEGMSFNDAYHLFDEMHQIHGDGRIQQDAAIQHTCASKKYDDTFRDQSPATRDDISDERDQLVCVTSRVFFLGLSIVKELLLRGYSVQLTDDNEGKLL
ncbi:hypothetical protein LguiA_024695 [Lonicera macranthoides]